MSGCLMLLIVDIEQLFIILSSKSINIIFILHFVL